jgi:hypothetical protein
VSFVAGNLLFNTGAYSRFPLLRLGAALVVANAGCRASWVAGSQQPPLSAAPAGYPLQSRAQIRGEFYKLVTIYRP